MNKLIIIFIMLISTSTQAETDLLLEKYNECKSIYTNIKKTFNPIIAKKWADHLKIKQQVSYNSESEETCLKEYKDLFIKTNFYKQALKEQTNREETMHHEKISNSELNKLATISFDLVHKNEYAYYNIYCPNKEYPTIPSAPISIHMKQCDKNIPSFDLVKSKQLNSKNKDILLYHFCHMIHLPEQTCNKPNWIYNKKLNPPSDENFTSTENEHKYLMKMIELYLSL